MKTMTFSGEPLVSFLDDGRNIRLAADFAFCDSKGRVWQCYKGEEANGTSYPRMLWSVSGGPWSTKSRYAAIIHDIECGKRTSSWQEVHHMFGEALIAAGVNEARAGFEFNAVWRFGPRWDEHGDSLAAEEWDDDYDLIGG